MQEDDDDLEAQIAAQVGEWSSNSNECFHITLLRSDGQAIATFQPEFTYPMFGEEEAIFGYRDLAIELTFAAHSMEPRLKVSAGEEYKAHGEIRPTDINEALSEFLPPEAFSSKAIDFGSARLFRPPGEKIGQYRRGSERFEIWCASLSDPEAKHILERMQVLVPMFIEGGTTLQLEQDWTTQRWKLFTLWSVGGSETDTTAADYSLVGYGTSYRVFTLPDRKQPDQADVDLFAPSYKTDPDFLPFDGTPASTAITSPLDLPSRERLSQFIILQPFQGAGHGQRLYGAMYRHLSSSSNVREFTIEDPNEAFDDLRDLCDLAFLRRHVPQFAALRVNTDVPADRLGSTQVIPTDAIVSGAARDQIRKQTKIDQRQFDRLVEMHTLSFIPPSHRSRSRITRREKTSNQHDRAYYFWRLYAKQRLLVFNRDTLMQLDREERIDKLEAAVDSVQEGYVKMIEKVEGRESEDVDGGADVEEEVKGGGRARAVKKRKVIDDEDDEGDDTEEAATNGGNKKSRTE